MLYAATQPLVYPFQPIDTGNLEYQVRRKKKAVDAPKTYTGRAIIHPSVEGTAAQRSAAQLQGSKVQTNLQQHHLGMRMAFALALTATFILHLHPHHLNIGNHNLYPIKDKPFLLIHLYLPCFSAAACRSLVLWFFFRIFLVHAFHLSLRLALTLLLYLLRFDNLGMG